MFFIPLIIGAIAGAVASSTLAGGGGDKGNKTISKNTITMIDNITNDVKMNMEKKCGAVSNNSQTVAVSIGKITGCKNVSIRDISQSIKTNVKIDCVTQNVTSIDLENILKKNFQQTASAKKSGTFNGIENETSAENNTNTTTNLANKINFDDVTAVLNDTTNIQGITVILGEISCGIEKTMGLFGSYTEIPGNFDITNISQAIFEEKVVKALLSSETAMKLVNDNEMIVKQEAAAALEGLDPGPWIYAIVLGIIVVSIMGVGAKYAGSSKSEEKLDVMLENFELSYPQYLITGFSFIMMTIASTISIPHRLNFSEKKHDEIKSTISMNIIVFLNIGSFIFFMTSCMLLVCIKKYGSSTQFLIWFWVLTVFSITFSVAIIVLTVLDMEAKKKYINEYFVSMPPT